MEYQITLPGKPRVISEDSLQGTYEIDALYPGYGYTLGNSLRRIILSSLPGAAITTVKIEDVPHEFATIDGVRESVMELLLNLKRVHFILHGDEPQTIKISVKGPKTVTAADIITPSQIEITNKDQYLCDISGKNGLELTATIERGLGYIPREVLTKEKVDAGTIALDATFTPIRRVNYEVDNMRVGDRTDFNRLRIVIETNGAVSPRKALEDSIEIMIHQLKAIVGFQEGQELYSSVSTSDKGDEETKLKLDELGLSARIVSTLEDNGIKSVAGLVRKSRETLLALDGVGEKAVDEIEAALSSIGQSLKP
jgi:DNA-directed RNA polymerase subunit alpha